ncbi:MotA/TolQ/ExbB proton channel family protein [Jannaschia sp. 2305UL9-9]|uniref:MotA/TolQ/ExbB proton channel family protein n=1 Tax=Jannaschia sp. 2305UL9-9 TaxID=3121638 RepID=UPI0035279C39
MDAVVQAQQITRDFIALGGPVVMVLIFMSVGALTVVIWKAGQFIALGVHRHGALDRALHARDAGSVDIADGELNSSRSHLAPVLRAALVAGPDADTPLRARIAADAEKRLERLTSGLGVLEAIAQGAPLIGLLGTVLGMIDAFRALQEAGAAVDPSILAGGIWVALLTTATGLVVAIPTQMALAWLEGRATQDRAYIASALPRMLRPLNG